MIIKIIQLIVLGFSIAGTILVFYNSPFYSSLVFLPNFDDSDKWHQKDLKKRRLAKV
jgi:hypothetical protein